MSHSTSLLKEIGSLSLVDARLELGSSSAAAVSLTPAPVSLADADATLTSAQLQSGLLIMTPTLDRLLTLPTAANMLSVLNRVGESVDVRLMNLGATGISLDFQAGSGGMVVGRDTVPSVADASGSALIRVRMTNVTSGSEAYVVYRLA